MVYVRCMLWLAMFALYVCTVVCMLTLYFLFKTDHTVIESRLDLTRQVSTLHNYE